MNAPHLHVPPQTVIRGIGCQAAQIDLSVLIALETVRAMRADLESPTPKSEE